METENILFQTVSKTYMTYKTPKQELNPDMPQKDIMTSVSSKWKLLTDAEKEKFITMSDTSKVHFLYVRCRRKLTSWLQAETASRMQEWVSVGVKASESTNPKPKPSAKPAAPKPATAPTVKPVVAPAPAKAAPAADEGERDDEAEKARKKLRKEKKKEKKEKKRLEEAAAAPAFSN